MNHDTYKTYSIDEQPPRELITKEALDDEAAKEELGESENRFIFLMKKWSTYFFAPMEKWCPRKTKKWRPGETLLVFRDQINKLAPHRKKDSDGTIGDEEHRKHPSDHNPWIIENCVGIVSAIDITDDKAGGCDVAAIVEKLRTSKDSRIKYVIWNKRIFYSQQVKDSSAWEWRPYNGSNAHSQHMHLSVKSDKESYDSTKPWTIA